LEGPLELSEGLDAAVLGLVEGITEFLPISSTGHLILVGDLIGFDHPVAKLFDVVIQLGAILAVVVLYFGRLWRVLVGLPSDVAARRFAVAVILAFLPSAVLGALIHDFIKAVLFSPIISAVTLIVGGFAILWIERHLPEPNCERVEDFNAKLALKIGLFQCLALIPGVSRAGATIMGALLLRVERKAATEFSFFLAIPTMLGASVYDLYKSPAELSADGSVALIAIGFIVAFLSALVVVRGLIGFVSRHGFAPFAWYRIVAGTALLAVWALGYG
jgi:undecaprenyl-diphosphatase